LGLKLIRYAMNAETAMALARTDGIALTLTLALAPPQTLTLHTMNAETPNMRRRVKIQKPMITWGRCRGDVGDM
jgi:hypothetical protein